MVQLPAAVPFASYAVTVNEEAAPTDIEALTPVTLTVAWPFPADADTADGTPGANIVHCA